MRAGLMSSRGVPRFGEGPLQGSYAVKDGFTFALIARIGEANGVVVGEALGHLGQSRRLGVDELEDDLLHRSPLESWSCSRYTDMRRGFDGLALLVQEHLKRDPHS